MNQNLTERQSRIYAYLKEQIAAGTTPTVREIAKEFGIASPNGVAVHLQALERKGYITREPHVRRGIHIVAQDGTR